MKTGKILALLMVIVMVFSTTVFAAEAFTDVAADAYYADAVAWAVEKEITNGMAEGLFAPDLVVNRAQAVTFLWRMAGCPEPTQTETYLDVEADPDNGWYKTAVQWAVEQGITNGTGDGLFSPAEPCARGMILTMLYRKEGKPFDEAAVAALPEDQSTWTVTDFGNSLVQTFITAYRSENGFTDVEQNKYYEYPVYWAALNGILDENQVDKESRAVQPYTPCLRGEMVYFLYRASGDAPVEGAVKTGEISETVLFDRDGVKLTATGIRSEGLGDVIVNVTAVNGTDKVLRAEAAEGFVNTFVISPQLCIPVESEEGMTFYSDAILQPGATQDCQLRLNSLDNMGIDTLRELELLVKLTEVEKDEDDYYEYRDEFAEGDMVTIRTSLYEDGVSYDLTGTELYDTDGLKVLALKVENNEYSGPQLVLYACNSSSEDVTLEFASLKLDGASYETYSSLSVPAGKRCVQEIYISGIPFDNIPTFKEAELTLQLVDQETGEAKATFDSVRISFSESE